MNIAMAIAATWILVLSGSQGFAQSFTRVTDQVIVTAGGQSGGSSWMDYDSDGYLDLFVANGNQSSQNNLLYRNDQMGAFTAVATDAVVTDGGSSIGGTWGDYDNDGYPDLFVSNRALSNGVPTKNFLYRNQGDGSFARISTGAIADDSADSNISSWVDIENDGDLDLFVVNFGQINFLYLNNGDATFTKSISEVINQSSFSISASWGDYNNDGYTDLFIGNGGSGRNLLFSNDGDGSFTQITSGPVVTDIASSTGCSWGDFNNDGNLDLIVANFLGANNFLYQNDGPPNYSFTRITAGPVVHDGGNSVGSVWGDLDNDGDLDLFVGNSGQNNFLYTNNGDGTFSKITSGALVGDGGMTFGVSIADPDRDGDLDVYAANINNENNFFYLNNGNGNRWISINCIGSTSNASAIGTKVRIKATQKGAAIWQLREIAAQSGYNSQSGLSATFGLADAAQVDSLKIEWPSGVVDEYVNLATSLFYTAAEGDTITVDGLTTSVSRQANRLPDRFELSQNFPNPFNPSTTISYSLRQNGFVTLAIHDLRGRQIATLVRDFQAAGSYTVNFNATLLASGTYFYSLRVGDLLETRKMLLLR